MDMHKTLIERMDKQRNGHFQRFFFNAIYERTLKKEGEKRGDFDNFSQRTSFHFQSRIDHLESTPNNDLLFLRNQFLPPGWNFLRHHHQQQLLSQWFHKEEVDSSLLLLKDGSCQWPGCEKGQLLNKNAFQQHLNSEHSFGQCSAAQVLILVH